MATSAAPKLTWRETATRELEDALKKVKKEYAVLEKTIEEQAKRDFTFQPPKSPIYYWGTVFGYAALHITLIVANVFFKLSSVELDTGFPINVGILIPLFQTWHLYESLVRIGVDDLAGFSFAGRPLYAPKSGLYVVPLGILQVIKASRNYEDKRFPGPADKIFRISAEQQATRPEGDAPPVGSGMVRPIFVTTGEPRLSSKDKSAKGERNPLDQQLSIEISYFVRYRVHQEHGGIFRIARNLSATSANIDERIENLMREQSERDMKAIITRLTYATILENLTLVNDVFLWKTKVAALRLGVDIDTAGLDDLNPSHKTNEAQAELARAALKKGKTITDAEAERARLILEGEGTATAEKARLEGIAAGYKKIKEDLGVDGSAVIASETTKDALGKAQTIVVGTQGVSELFGLAAAGKEALLNTKTNQKNGDAKS